MSSEESKEAVEELNMQIEEIANSLTLVYHSVASQVGKVNLLTEGLQENMEYVENWHSFMNRGKRWVERNAKE